MVRASNHKKRLYRLKSFKIDLKADQRIVY